MSFCKNTIRKREQLWELLHRTRKGPPPKYKTPNDLWEKAVEYFKWADDNPILVEYKKVDKGEVIDVDYHKPRAMVLRSMYAYLRIAPQTWKAMKKRREKPEGEEFSMADMCEIIETVVWEQKFTLAAAAQLNPMIIVRELGLADKHEETIKDESDNDKKPLSNLDLARRVAYVMNQVASNPETPPQKSETH